MCNHFFVSMEDNFVEPAWLPFVEIFMQKVMDKLSYSHQEISILFCHDSFIQVLNKQYRDIDSPTDVLSFENGTEYDDTDGIHWIMSGDIVISLDMLPVNASYFHIDEDSELKRLLVHGLLHLNGFDHGDIHVGDAEADNCEMLVLQEELLESFREEKIIK